MYKKFDVGTELRKVASGRKSKLNAQALAEIVLAGFNREPKTRKRDDVRFLEALHRLPDVRE
jgi:hypothetical protein